MNGILICKAVALLFALFTTFALLVQLVFAHAKIGRNDAATIRCGQIVTPAIFWAIFYLLSFSS